MPICCPGCGAQAEELRLEGHYGRRVAIDACRSCSGLWLDGLEGIALSPAGILSLLRTVDDRTGDRRPLGAHLVCPRCSATLLATEDRQRTTTFNYYRCPVGHGRFITFFQFLRSRNFVRELTSEELRDLREHVQSVNCSNCGAPVDVARASACNYCHTPISTVEPGQIRKEIEELERTAARGKEADPLLPLRMFEARTETERAFREAGQLGGTDTEAWHLLDLHAGEGLVEKALTALLRHLSKSTGS